MCSLIQSSDEPLRDMLELNLVAAQAGVHAAAQRMGTGGAIVHSSSRSGVRAAPNTGTYGGAKAAVLSLKGHDGGRAGAVQGVRQRCVALNDVLEFTEAYLPG